MKLLLRVCEGRRKGGNRGMGNHIERNLSSFLIAAALFTSVVDGQYDSIAIPPAQRYPLAVFSPPSPQAFSIQLRRELLEPSPAPSSPPPEEYPPPPPPDEYLPALPPDEYPPASPPDEYPAPPPPDEYPAPPPPEEYLPSPPPDEYQPPSPPDEYPPPPPPSSPPPVEYAPPPSRSSSPPMEYAPPPSRSSSPPMEYALSNSEKSTASEGNKSNMMYVIVGTIIAGIPVFASIEVAIMWKYKKKPAKRR